MLARRRPTRRRGMTIVESALVLTVFLMLLFGIFEYARFLLVLHVTSNAARDGARYATVNVNKDPAVFGEADIVTFTTARMGGVNKQIEGFAVDVFPCDTAGAEKTPAASYTWNQAAFSEKIAVRVWGKYRPFLPTLLRMTTTIDVDITSKMGSEG